MGRGMRSILLAAFALFIPLSAQAEPYRAFVTRTTETTGPGNIELGMRYDSFLLGTGSPTVDPSAFHRLGASLRWGILEHLELEVQPAAFAEFRSGDSSPHGYFADLPVALQWTFLDTPGVELGVYGRATLPTGPSGNDLIPPTLSNGALGLEGTFLAEFHPARDLRFIFNLGAIHHGTRNRDPRSSFDVPAALRYDGAVTYNMGERLLLSLEMLGYSYFSSQITPAWTDNQHQVEVMPGLRYEASPGLVLEAALGVSVSSGLRQLQAIHPVLGFTYEFGPKAQKRHHNS
jgi:hypothetical protein